MSEEAPSAAAAGTKLTPPNPTNTTRISPSPAFNMSEGLSPASHGATKLLSKVIDVDVAPFPMPSSHRVSKRIKVSLKQREEKEHAAEEKNETKKSSKGRKKSKRGRKRKNPNTPSAPPSKKAKGIMDHRRERKRQLQKEKESMKKERDLAGGKKVCSDLDGDFFWEVEKVLGRRVQGSRVEYLIRWKGCTEADNTWEPAANLCDTALSDALKFWREEKAKMKKREEDELRLFGPVEEEEATTKMEKHLNMSALKGGAMQGKNGKVKGKPQKGCDDEQSDGVKEDDPSKFVGLGEVDEADGLWNWTDAEQVKFREVRRINVHDANARDLVTEARRNGTPVVLVGHVGWANFAKRWLRRKTKGLMLDKNEDGMAVVGSAGTMEESERVKGDGNSLNGTYETISIDSRAGQAGDTSVVPSGQQQAQPETGPDQCGEEKHFVEAVGTRDLPSNSGNREENKACEVSARKPESVEDNVCVDETGEKRVVLTEPASTDKEKSADDVVQQVSQAQKNLEEGVVPLVKCGEVAELEKSDNSFEEAGETTNSQGNQEDSGVEHNICVDGTGEKRVELTKPASTDKNKITGEGVQAQKNLDKGAVPVTAPKKSENGKGLEEAGGTATSQGSQEDSGNDKVMVETEQQATEDISVGEAQPHGSEKERDCDQKLLDLSDASYELDIPAMIEDIGLEDIPVVRRNYNELDPIHGVIPAAKFLKASWPNHSGNAQSDWQGSKNNKDSSSDSGLSSGSTAHPRLYLHQWQFPLSDTAGRKLCHQNTPLPHDILGMDLLRHWLDLPQCQNDSPLQYIFMGREETMSKLHKDNGGLAISIAPIVGQKECVLVHRSDGSNCLYHLSARLDEEIDLHVHPLLSQARIWKTVIQPGEILLMPHGTYHQCRNLTPCLSYSRFHLDTTNLLPFLQSFIDGDAPELQHDDVLWNCTSDLIRRVDAVVDEAQSRVKSHPPRPVPRVDEEMVKTVDTLRVLRHIVREVARRIEVKNAVKGKRRGVVPAKGLAGAGNGVSDGPWGHGGMNGSASATNGNDAGDMQRKNQTETCESTENDWNTLVDDVDVCLHEFRYRCLAKIPSFRPRRLKTLLENALSSGATEDDLVSEDNWAGNDASAPVVAYDTDLDRAYLYLRNATVDDTCASLDKSIVGKLAEGDGVTVRLERKRVPGRILQIEPDLHAAYLSYEDYPSLYDEFQPYELLRSPSGCEGMGSEIPHDEIKPGLVVVNRWGEKKEEYRAVVQITTCETMYKILLDLGGCTIERWFTCKSILERKSPVCADEHKENEGEPEKATTPIQTLLQGSGDKVQLTQ